MSSSRAPSNTGVAIGTPRRSTVATSTNWSSIEAVDLVVLAVDLGQFVTQRLDFAVIAIGIDQCAPICLPRPAQAQPEMGFENLADIHAATARPAD